MGNHSLVRVDQPRLELTSLGWSTLTRPFLRDQSTGRSTRVLSWAQAQRVKIITRLPTSLFNKFLVLLLSSDMRNSLIKVSSFFVCPEIVQYSSQKWL